MNEEEIKILEMEVMRPRNKELWQKAFDIYNKETNSKLNMNCFICFPKVLVYHKKKLVSK